MKENLKDSPGVSFRFVQGCLVLFSSPPLGGALLVNPWWCGQRLSSSRTGFQRPHWVLLVLQLCSVSITELAAERLNENRPPAPTSGSRLLKSAKIS